jgi:hypothetical protein
MNGSSPSWRCKSRRILVGILIVGLLAPVQMAAQAQSPQIPLPSPMDIPGSEDIGVESLDQPAGIEWYNVLAPAQPGFPVALDGAYLIWGSSPTLVDLNGDGSLEILVGGRDLVGGNPGDGGMVYAYRWDGSLFWEKHVRAPVNSTPTAADLTGDGHPDVVVSMGGLVEPPRWNGGVIALDGLNGDVLWTFDTQDWLNHEPDGWLDGVFSTPAIADINADGYPEITFGAWDQCIYLLDRDGQPLWGNIPDMLGETYCGGHGYYNEDTIWSSPALADVTGDGRLEIIVGADVSPGNVWGDSGGGYLYVFDADGNVLARAWMDQTIFSSPAAADLDDDGEWEFVVGTGTYWANQGYYVSAFDYDPSEVLFENRLKLKWRKDTVGRVFASPAIADLNKDGELDVVITVPTGDGGEDGTFVYAWSGDSGAELWKRRACDMWGNSGNTLSSPTVADIDGDTWPEVLFSHTWEVAILNHDGTYYTDYTDPEYPSGPNHPGCARDHEPTTRLSYWAEYSLYASPAIGDLDSDGDAEVVIPGHNPDNPNQGMIFAWTGHPVEAGPAWATWRHDEQHTGNKVFELIPPTNPTSLSSQSHTPGTWSSSNTVLVSWSGAQDLESGLGGYSVVWDTEADTLPDVFVDLGADATNTTSPPLSDGKSHYFHLRTADRAGNWTATALHLGPFWIDSTPPTSAALSPQVVTGPFRVTWNGSDETSGLASYTIEVRDGDGAWSEWLADETDSSAIYEGDAGHVYHFRSIARDRAGNRETAYTATGDTATAVARYLLGGKVYDQRGRPIERASVSAQPEAMNVSTTGSDGQFALGLATEGTYDVTAYHPRYSSLPPMKGIAVYGDIGGVDFYLPPASNLIENGDFESSGGWEMGGVVPPTRVQEAGHTGDFALQIGALTDQADPSTAWTWAISQSITIPQMSEEATLDWFYRVEGDAKSGASLLVTVRSASSEISRPIALDVDGWTHDWIDVTGLAGEQVVVSFTMQRKAEDAPVTAWLDEIGLGAATNTTAFLPLVQRSH